MGCGLGDQVRARLPTRRTKGRDEGYAKDGAGGTEVGERSGRVSVGECKEESRVRWMMGRC